MKRSFSLTFMLSAVTLALSAAGLFAQDSGPVVVQPGAPGQATKTLPSSKRPTLTPLSPKDVEFMQGMIIHHAQAVEMTALIDERSENRDLRRLGARIRHTQTEEMKMMQTWLLARGQSVQMPQGKMAGMNMSMPAGPSLMPGMLSQRQMEALKNAKGKEFDRLFLIGMIQHHNGALIMVKDLFDTAGAGQDADLFNFASDVDSGQRAEIRVMQSMLDDRR